MEERRKLNPVILAAGVVILVIILYAARDRLPFLRDLPLGSSHIVARRMLTPWGRRFEFVVEMGGPAAGPRIRMLSGYNATISRPISPSAAQRVSIVRWRPTKTSPSGVAP